MRGLNRRIISYLNDAATNALGHYSSHTAAYTILDTLQTQKVVSRFHTYVFSNPISTLSGLRGAAALKPPSLPSQFKFFSTNPVGAPKNSTVIPRRQKQHFGNGPEGASHRTSWARYLLAVPPVICAGLCKWQLDRRQWKIDLLERRQRIMKGEPVDIFSESISYPEEYQRVIATGVFDHARTQYIGPRPRSRMGTTEVGYLAVTPLIFTEKKDGKGGDKSTKSFFNRENNTSNNKNNKNSSSNSFRKSGERRREVLVLRGWVPSSWRDSSDTEPTAANSETQSQVTIQGVIRFGEDPGTFVPDNKPEDGTWFYINADQLANAVGLPAGTPLIEVISSDEEIKMLDSGPTVLDVLGGRGKLPSAPQEIYPLAKSEGDMGAFSVMPRDHLNYALTWFTLMVATGGMAFKALRKRK